MHGWGVHGATYFTIDFTCDSDAECDDGIPCTIDECIDEACVRTPDDTLCDDGLFCTGAEFCWPYYGCADGPDPCTEDQQCREATQQPCC